MFAPLEKCVGYSLKIMDIVKKFGPLSENSSPLLVSQAGYGPGSENERNSACVQSCMTSVKSFFTTKKEPSMHIGPNFEYYARLDVLQHFSILEKVYFCSGWLSCNGYGTASIHRSCFQVPETLVTYFEVMVCKLFSVTRRTILQTTIFALKQTMNLLFM